MTEAVMVPGRRLGRRKPVDKPALKLSNFLAAIPAHPLTKNNLDEVNDYGLYGNDRYGDCGPTCVANFRKLVTKHNGNEESPTQNDVFDLYRRSGNPNFDPNTDADDNGVVMQDMLEAVQKGGIGNVEAVAFAKVDVTNLDEIRAAIDIFGGLLLGINLLVAQQAQTDEGRWDYVRSAEWGGHAVLAGSYTSKSSGDISVITWAEEVLTTDSFWLHQVEEAWVVIWPEHFTMPGFDQAVNVEQLAADYKALTGKTLVIPTPVDPTPPVNPTPSPEPVEPTGWQKMIDEIKQVLQTLEQDIKKFFS